MPTEVDNPDSQPVVASDDNPVPVPPIPVNGITPSKAPGTQLFFDDTGNVIIPPEFADAEDLEVIL